MPRQLPPDLPAGRAPRLREYRLAAGTPLWRVMEGRYIDRTSYFNPRLAGVDDPSALTPSGALPEFEELGGRFDGTEADRYGICYAALDDLTTIAETLLRDEEFAGETRPLPFGRVWGREFVVMSAEQDLTLVDLTTAAALAVARQDTWLVQAGRRDYWRTRRWASWMRACAPGAHGLIWPSGRNPGGLAVALFSDRCQDLVLRRPLATIAVDGSSGLCWLNRRLEALRTYVCLPEDLEPDKYCSAPADFVDGGRR